MSLSIDTGPAALVVAAVATALGVLLLLGSLRALRGTTLLAPCAWALLGMLAVGGVEIVAGLLAGDTPPSWLAAVRYTAAVSSLAPVVALLGAKRPQDAAWKFIVLALLAILAMPAATALLISRGGGVETHVAQQWFTAALIAIGPLNYLPTRYAIAAVILALAQIWLLAEHLPGGQALWGANVPHIALAMLSAAIATAYLSRQRGLFTGAMGSLPALVGLRALSRKGGQAAHGTRRSIGAIDGERRLWVDFRTMYGALWSLRVAQRVSEQARLQGWPVRLTWRGLVSLGDQRKRQDELSEEVSRAAYAALRTMLARFVSPRWIADRRKES